MATNAQWLALANRMFNVTFAGQTGNTIVLTQQGDYDPINGGYTQVATDTITVARVYDFTDFERQADGVTLADRKIAFVNNPLNCEITQTLDCTVNGRDVNIKKATLDEAGAVWTFHVGDL